MKTTNKNTVKHETHKIVTKRAAVTAPHFGYYHCVTCRKFVTWIDKATYYAEQAEQATSAIMWFGKHQGTSISELSNEYLDWVLVNVNKPNMEPLIQEWSERYGIKA
jgi:hypothetical protein